MHKHPINYEIPHVGKVAIDVEHEPLNDKDLLVKVQLITVPKALGWAVPKKYFKEPIVKTLPRSLVQGWAEKLSAWANEPAEEVDL